MTISDREKAFGKSDSKYFWCLSCERAYVAGEYRTVDGHQMCPYQECSGDAVIDAWEWEKVRDANPAYPEEPEQGKLYPLYH